IMEIENLAFAIELALDGVSNQSLIILGDDGLNGQPILWRRLDGAHVTRTGEREMQGARDRRGAQSEDIHELSKQLELFFVQNAEVLLVIDDHQAEIFEGDVVLNEAMRSDDDVDVSVR